MKIIERERGKGKTTQLIYIADYTGLPIVVPDNRNKRYTLELAEFLGCKNIIVYTEDQVVRKQHLEESRRVLVDDMDKFITPLSKLDILVDTATKCIGFGSKSYEELKNHTKLMKHYIDKSRILSLVGVRSSRDLIKESLSDVEKIIAAFTLLNEVGFKEVHELDKKCRS